MIFTFEREPLGWIHPCHRRRVSLPRGFICDLSDFVGPALESMSTLNQLLDLAQHQPRNTHKQDKFEVKVDVHQFSPEELDVKMVDNCVIVEGKHEEKKDEHGFVSRHFVRRYELPADVKQETVTCNFSSDGILRISAPRMIEEKQPPKETTVPINVTGQPSEVTASKGDKAEEAEEANTAQETNEKMETTPLQKESDAA